MGPAKSKIADVIEARSTALTAAELAEHLNVSTASVYRLVARGRITAMHLGVGMRFDPRTTAEWIRERTVPILK